MLLEDKERPSRLGAVDEPDTASRRAPRRATTNTTTGATTTGPTTTTTGPGTTGPARTRRTLSTAVHVSEILRLLSEEPQGAPAKALARKLGQSLSSTYYTLQTLASVGMVEPSPSAPGLYTLGPLIADLYRGYVANHLLPERMAPVVARLRDATGARSYLAAWTDGDLEVTVVLGRRGSAELQDVSSGFRGGAHALAPGKVLLAATHPRQWPDYVSGHHLEKFTDATLDTAGKLHLELQRVREQGYATDVQEFRENVCCLSAPVRDAAGRVLAAVAISVPARRFGRERDRLLREVVAAASAASAAYAELDPLSALLRAAGR